MKSPRRSSLIAPADNAHLMAKLAAGPEDIAVLELEDGVHADRKEHARQGAVESLKALDWGQREKVVRINPVPSGHAEKDIAVVLAGRPDGVMMTKAAGADEVHHVSQLLAEAEKAHGVEVGSTQIWAMIESALGLVNVEAICAADPRMTAVFFGAGDYAADIQVKRISLGSFRRHPLPAIEYIYARGRVVAAARAFGLDPLDVGSSDVRDMDLNRAMAEFSAQMGFRGAACFSPRQVVVVNKVYGAAPDDVEWADSVLTAVADVQQGNKNVAVVNGEMIDGPFVENARQILARAAVTRAFEHAPMR